MFGSAVLEQLNGVSILSASQFDRATLDALVREAEQARDWERLPSWRLVADVFYEPSTRTRMSFSAAAQRLGWGIDSLPVDMSSEKKGEQLLDTFRTISSYADLIVARLGAKGVVAEVASDKHVTVPVINAGDGDGEHPTQALLDLYTIWRAFRHQMDDNLTIGLVGDLLYGRTVHSLVQVLSHYDVNFVYVSPDRLGLPQEYRGLRPESFFANLEDCIGDLDVIYMTRVQAERFSSAEEYREVSGLYRLDMNLMSQAKDTSIVMHPLPRVDEIAEEVDDDSRAVYFPQMKNGMYMRMALLKSILA